MLHLAKDNLPEPKTWNNDLKELIFGDDEILDGSHLFSLDTPYRALDAAIVPISINFKIDQKEDYFIKIININHRRKPFTISF